MLQGNSNKGSFSNPGRDFLTSQNVRNSRSNVRLTTMQLERRKPPTKLSAEQASETFKLWVKGQSQNKYFVELRRITEYPEMEKNLSIIKNLRFNSRRINIYR